jgi:hypothetical protein
VSFQDGKRRFAFNLRQIAQTLGNGQTLGGIDRGFVDQQNRQPIAHRVHPPASCALQGLRIALQLEILLACRANDQVEEILGDHDAGLYDGLIVLHHRVTETQRKTWRTILDVI